MMGVCVWLSHRHTHRERHRPDRQRGKEMRKMQWKSRKARGSREKRETRSVHEQVEQHLQERRNLLSKSLPKPKTSKPNKKNPQEDKEKGDSLWLSPHTEKNFGNNKYKLQKTTKQNKTKTEKMYVVSYFVAAAECFFSSLSLSLSLCLPFCFNFVMI